VALGTMRPPGAPPDDELTDEQARQLEKQVSRYIVRRRGTPDDVAALITFLASPQASWITGQTYPLNGGYSLSL
jgi:NAD(P)-dependent dehydrogenase (short-subunit alcohol dehydrogenase family)